jgi:hypothetical protein
MYDYEDDYQMTASELAREEFGIYDEDVTPDDSDDSPWEPDDRYDERDYPRD